MRRVGRTALFTAVAAFAFIAGLEPAMAQMTLTDVAGRQVELAGPAKRILLEAPAYYPALALLSGDAALLIVGVGGTVGRGSTEAEADIDAKPRLGTIASGNFSIESAIALKPDLMIAPLDQSEPNPAVEAAFASLGIPILYVDFFVDAAANSVPSMELIGRAIGEEERAEEFIEFYRSRMAAISERLEAAGSASSDLLIYRRSADETCCWSFSGGFISTFFDMLQVNNIAEGMLPGMLGQLSLEAVIRRDPDILVVTDMSVGADSLFAPTGSRADRVAALEALGARTGLSELAAVRNRRMHAIDITLMRSPLNILAVELLAKWSHPELFADLDPEATLDEINARFLSVPLRGPFWTSLEASADTASGPHTIR